MRHGSQMGGLFGRKLIAQAATHLSSSSTIVPKTTVTERWRASS